MSSRDLSPSHEPEPSPIGATRAREGLPWPALALIAATAIGFAWLIWRPSRSGGLDLDAFQAHAGAQRFDEAEALLVNHLRAAPQDAQAHFLLAQLILERTDHPAEGIPRIDAERALALLDALATLDPAAPAAALASRSFYRGAALRHLHRWDAAEQAWLEAIRLDPAVPEAGWALLDLYYLEGRTRDARELALRLYETEPDPRDRASLLLQLVRQDAIRPDALSLVPLFEPVLAAEPEALHSTIGMGVALVKSNEIDRGLTIMHGVVERHPSEIAAWEGLLAALDLSGRLEELERTLARVPAELLAHPRLARFRALGSQQKQDWSAAADALLEAVRFDPTDTDSLGRIERILRFAGRTDEANTWAARAALERDTRARLLDLYEEANDATALGVRSYPELCERLAVARERMRRPDEAARWRQIGSGIATRSASPASS